MSRIHIKRSVIGYLEKSLSPEKQKAMEEHISVCQVCREFVARMASVYFSNEQQVCPELPPYFYTRVMARLEKEKMAGSELPVSVIRTLRPVAAGLFLLTAITFSIFFSNYVISTNQLNTNSQVNPAGEMSYEYYLGNGGDPMVNLIISNEN